MSVSFSPLLGRATSLRADACWLICWRCVYTTSSSSAGTRSALVPRPCCRSCSNRRAPTLFLEQLGIMIVHVMIYVLEFIYLSDSVFSSFIVDEQNIPHCTALLSRRLAWPIWPCLSAERSHAVDILQQPEIKIGSLLIHFFQQ